jgi:hypothetical protein
MAELTFLLEDADISGTARLVMAHADALVARGHRVRSRQFAAGSRQFAVGSMQGQKPPAGARNA